MSTALQIAHWLAGFVVLAEALNKLERSAPFAPGLTYCARLISSLKSLAWALLALGGYGAVAAPVLLTLGVNNVHMPVKYLVSPTVAEMSLLIGFAVLIIHTRVKEG